MKELFENIKKAWENGESTVLATIIASSGSIPRGIGARMLVGFGGRICGTIGGGAVERRAEALAMEALTGGRSFVKPFLLNKSDVEDLGMICGGDVRVFFQYLDAKKPETRALADDALAAFTESDTDSWLITELTDESDWSMFVYAKNSPIPAGLTEGELQGLLKRGAVRTTESGRRFYTEPLHRTGKVIIFGGGHIARELVPVLSRLEFRCVVFDDRPDFASRERFPDAEDVILGDLEDIAAGVTITDRDYVVVMTRGHTYDFIVQSQILRLDTAYAGVIGSRAKAAAVAAKLRETGISEEKLKRVHSPIGLSIKAETPAEIAVSIAAELVEVRASITRGE